MKRLILVVCVLLEALPGRAAFEDLGAGARAAGLGNAFVPVADDVYTIYYNPAGLGTLERPEAGTSYSLLYPGLTDGSNINTSFVAWAQPLKEGKYGTLGAAWNAFSVNSSIYREDSFYLSYGRLIWNSSEYGELFAGATAKYLRRSFAVPAEASNAVLSNGVTGSGQADPLLSAAHTQTAFDGDMGLLYRPSQRFSAGLSAIHVGQPNVSFGDGGVDQLPLLVKVGVDYRSLISNLVAEFDTQNTPAYGQDNIATVGAERWFPRTFAGDTAARAALGIGSRDYKEIDAGLSYRTHRFQIDYALGVPIGGLGTSVSSHKVSLSFRFGRSTEAEESLEMVLEAMKQLKAGQTPSVAGTKGALTGTPRALFDERMALVRGLESRAKYAEALAEFDQAMQLSAPDQQTLDRYGRLSFVGQQIKFLPDYKTDPVQASLHVGLLAYLAGDNLQAVEKVAYALSLRPQWKELDSFLAQLETVTGVKRGSFPARKRLDEEAALKLARANADIEDGYDEEAASLARDVVRIEPRGAAGWEVLGTAYFALKKYDDSLNAWEKAREFEANPAIREAIKQTIRSVKRARDQSPAVAPKPAASAGPQPATISESQQKELFDAALDHYARREFTQAKDLLEQLLQGAPDNADAQKALRRVEEDMK